MGLSITPQPVDPQAPRAAPWLDEALVGVIVIPWVLTFIPGVGHVLVAQGFDAMGHAPSWYTTVALAATAFVFGPRALRAARDALPVIHMGKTFQALPSTAPAA